MKFCSRCGGQIERRVPDGDNRERAVCGACEHIHYENPRVVVGCVVEDAGRVLMCKRAIEPRMGRWTLPAGFLELGESSAEGAVRETHEEAGASVEIVAPYTHLDVPAIGQVYLFYRARMRSPEYAAGPESLEVQWMTPQQLPWDELSFSVVRETLRLWVAEHAGQRYRIHRGVVHRDDRGSYTLHEHSGHAID